jgi:hypothetical protein
LMPTDAVQELGSGASLPIIETWRKCFAGRQATVKGGVNLYRQDGVILYHRRPCRVPGNCLDADSAVSYTGTHLF